MDGTANEIAPATAPYRRPSRRNKLQLFLLGGLVTSLALVFVHRVLAPEIGAPEGERVLAIGPLVISELTYEVGPNGAHQWEQRTNLWLIAPLVLLGGLAATRRGDRV